MPEFENHGSSEELIRHIRDRRDDIDCVRVPLCGWFKITSPDGSEQVHKDIGAVIQFCNGSFSAIHYVDAEILLNDGILHNLRIPIRLVPEGQPLND